MREILFKRNPNNDKEAKKAKKSDLTMNELRNTELPQLSNIVNFCANVPISLYSDTTIVKTPETCFRGLYYSTNRLAGEEFLLNYRRSNSDLSMVIGIKAYKSFQVRGAMANRPLLEEEVLQESLKLPPPGKLNVPLGPVIQSRRSKRNFSGKPIEMKDLSTLLFYCQGVSGIADISLDIEGGLPATKTLGMRIQEQPAQCLFRRCGLSHRPLSHRNRCGEAGKGDIQISSEHPFSPENSKITGE